MVFASLNVHEMHASQQTENRLYIIINIIDYILLHQTENCLYIIIPIIVSD